MASFWDARGTVFIDYLEKGTTINGKYYANLLKRLSEEHTPSHSFRSQTQNQDNGFRFTSTSRRYLLRTRIESVKDKKACTEKSGTYKISCSDCDLIYIGQSKQLLCVRVLEHIKEAEFARKNGNPHIKSALAKHVKARTTFVNGKRRYIEGNKRRKETRPVRKPTNFENSLPKKRPNTGIVNNFL